MRRTKIVATMGPSVDENEILKNMIEAGMNVARLNFSHGDHKEHLKRINAIRKVASDTCKNISILMDTKGPEIRIGEFENEAVTLNKGDKFTLTTREIKGNKEIVSVSYKNLPDDVSVGNTILLADGLISLEVLNIQDTDIECEVKNGEQISNNKGVNLPAVSVNLPPITEQDREDIEFGINNNLDFIAVSLVHKPDDIISVKRMLEEKNASIDIIAKIENREAVNNIDRIIKISDGIMVARGDLGVEIPAEEVPLLQKIIIDKCNRAGKPVITATQMLESMIDNPRPTRAEASDVANAILDGTDAVMLSGESAAGKYPVEVITTMACIARTAESGINYKELLERKGRSLSRTITDAISYATCSTAHDLEAAAIISSTESGYTPKMVSKYKPRAPIIAVTPNTRVQRKLSLIWGIEALQVDYTKDTDSMISTAVEVSLNESLVKPGDLVVITAGVPVAVHGTTNLLKVHTIGNILARGIGVGEHAVTGTIKIARTYKDAHEKIEKGDILVCVSTDKEYVPVMKNTAAIITEVSGITSHAAIMGLEYGIPVIVGVESATAIFSDEQVITVDTLRGLIYAGTAQVF
ncbi:MAG: pyruvate kinase [Clostridiales bacterium]|nr:pyruvate kinase [Clostridiales bacterium]MCF8021650.1 pyruvate kinase [Clostridiales bacterium]